VPNQKKRIKSLDEIITTYYLRLTVADECGILAQIASILGENSISIASCIQKDADKVNGIAQIVIMTHPALESNMQKAVVTLKRCPSVKKVHNLIRVEE
ncbi:MAG: ACT domain-containing protein, partial [Dehalococcoidales bacterium]|nr:ACT domain-containing protein [Dehalococcoidales bacterium]